MIERYRLRLRTSHLFVVDLAGDDIDVRLSRLAQVVKGLGGSAVSRIAFTIQGDLEAFMGRLEIEAESCFVCDDDAILILNLDNSQTHHFLVRQKKGRQPLVEGQKIPE